MDDAIPRNSRDFLAQFSRAGAEPPPRGAISRQPACGHQEPGSEAWRGRNVGASRFREVGSREPRAERAGEPRTEPARVGIGRKEVGDMLRKRSQSGTYYGEPGLAVCGVRSSH